MNSNVKRSFGYLKAIGFSLGSGFIVTLICLFTFPFFAMVMLEHSMMKPTIGNILMANGSVGSMVAIFLFIGMCFEYITERK
ncbi:MAG: hypothetical protein ACNFW9_05315 [Candidatus Kerfeldbacteria bacterium]